jgi:hypothetical protein
LIEPVRGRRDAVPEEQQHTDLAVQLLGLRELRAQLLDFSVQLRFRGDGGVHGKTLRDSIGNNTTYNVIFRIHLFLILTLTV